MIPISSNGAARNFLALRCLGLVEKLPGAAAHFLFTGSFEVGSFLRFKHDGRANRARQGEANQKREKKDAKRCFIALRRVVNLPLGQVGGLYFGTMAGIRVRLPSPRDTISLLKP